MSFVTRLRSAVQTRFDRLSRFTTYLAKDDEKDDENVKAGFEDFFSFKEYNFSAVVSLAVIFLFGKDFTCIF